MNVKTKNLKSEAIKVVLEENGGEIGRGYIFFMFNELHNKPFAYIEDVFIEEKYRGQKLSKKIFDKIIELCKEKDCYKIVATSRFEREELHNYYEKLGFEKKSYGFRMDLE